MSGNSKSTGPSDASAHEPLLDVENLKKHFAVEQGILDRTFGEEKWVHAVDGVSLSLDRNETIGVVGESGCGKSTLGRTLARLYEPTAGTIRFDGGDITTASGNRLKALRKDVQVIFQDPLSSLNPRKTVGEIVAKPLEVHDIATGEALEERVDELFEEVGLDPSYRDRYPHEFSGGQRQRIGIARALAVEPKLIVADEPVSALDVSVQAQIINLMKRLQREYGLSYLFIAHDLSVVKHVSDRVAVMYLGKIVESGPTDEIFEKPVHPYTKALLSAIPSVEGDGSRRKTILEGNPPSPIDVPSGCPFHTRCPEYIDGDCEATEPEPMVVGTPSGSEDRRSSEALSDSSTGARDHRAACHWVTRPPGERRRQDPYSPNRGEGTDT
ncbi:ABC transporter ATP-binding protein [Halomarina pelagica]|uniref:ABC transporter ATP-binding protein n=1 Tax=Halomarina pelagica TaxID=2961599 RepID=UPI0020C3C92F|nr:oligopeptide/dipeptide ABC transporter ATP-binding protein [Halomarina sp. BND7]